MMHLNITIVIIIFTEKLWTGDTSEGIKVIHTEANTNYPTRYDTLCEHSSSSKERTVGVPSCTPSPPTNSNRQQHSTCLIVPASLGRGGTENIAPTRIIKIG